MIKFIQWFDDLAINRKHIYNIIMGVIGSAIFGFLWWLLYSLYINIVPIINILLNVNASILDYIYRQIAQGDGLDYQSSIMISLMLGGFIGYLLRKNNSKEIQKPIIEVIASKVNYYISIMIVLFLIIMSIYKYNITRDFNQDISIIAPYISESEIKIIKSNFAQIQGLNDFNKIQETIKNIQLKNNIKISN